MFFLCYKKEGETPLDALERLRLEKGIDASVPMTYAGRLDPMAEGLLIILSGEECKKKDGYLGLDKEYEVEILLGIGSDTGDILGIIKIEPAKGARIDLSEKTIKEKIQALIGKRSEKYPAFSSKPVSGRPLFVHAREGSLGDIDIPEKEIEIYSIDLVGIEDCSDKALIDIALKRLNKVKGDFRQSEVVDSWKPLLKEASDRSVVFQIITLRISCSSGAYMRTLAEKVGASLGTSALAWTIKRTKIGAFSI